MVARQRLRCREYDQMPTKNGPFKQQDQSNNKGWYMSHMATLTRKKSLVFTSQDKQLGITQAMLKSRMQASGYDLSKVQGYRPDAKICCRLVTNQSATDANDGTGRFQRAITGLGGRG